MTLKDIIIAGKLTVSEGGGGGISADDWLGRTVSGTVETSLTSLKNVLDGCNLVERFIAPELETLYNSHYTFRGCSSLEYVSFPKLRFLYGQNQFENCTKLPGLVFPSLLINVTASGDLGKGQLYAGFAAGCTSLKYVDCYSLSSVANNAFKGASVFDTLVIRHGKPRFNGKTPYYDQVPDLQNIGAFTNTPFASGGAGGTLYVPSDMISAYQAASNWSTILGYANNQIKAIEGSYYETHYADGTPIA